MSVSCCPRPDPVQTTATRYQSIMLLEHPEGDQSGDGGHSQGSSYRHMEGTGSRPDLGHEVAVALIKKRGSD